MNKSVTGDFNVAEWVSFSLSFSYCNEVEVCQPLEKNHLIYVYFMQASHIKIKIGETFWYVDALSVPNLFKI